LGPNTLLNTLFSNTLSLRSSINVSDQFSHPYKTTGKIILTYADSLDPPGTYSQPGGSSKWCLYKKLGMLITSRQRHIVLLFYRDSCWKQRKNWWTGTLRSRSWVSVLYIDKNLTTKSGKSTETALHSVVTHTEEAMENKEVTIWALLDNKEAFDSTSLYIIIETDRRHGLEDIIFRWISDLLGNRKIRATLAGATLEGSKARGCPQGGGLSLLIC
jgi:hypothetical protein